MGLSADDVWAAARMFALDPVGLGGMWLRGAGPARDTLLEALRAWLPLRRLPVGVDDERLLGGLDLGASLGAGRPVARAGLLAEAHGGVLCAGLAERMPDAVAGRIALAMDQGCVRTERDGASVEAPAAFGLLLLDDGVEAEQRPPSSLMERVAFHVDFSDLRFQSDTTVSPACSCESVELPDGAVEALASAALALGIGSARALLFALRAARASAAIAGRATAAEEDVARAARLVLAPRAVQLPPEAEEDEAQREPAQGERDEGQGRLEDVVLDAARAALPPGLFAEQASAGRGSAPRARGSGERRRSMARGRPAGVRAGLPRGGARLAVIETLRAAAPWQKLRAGGADARIQVRRPDLRVRRFEERAQQATIFVVDASGSSAAARLAEAKGAVELMLARAYATRAEVALVAFRGTAAELLLPATRSLTRARRALAELPGGGGTPLAAGLDAGLRAAAAVKARGRTPMLVVLSDGRANVASDGSGNRAQALADAEAAGQRIAAAGVDSVLIDISARPQPEAAGIAQAMGARYLPLPRADAAAVHRAVEG